MDTALDKCPNAILFFFSASTKAFRAVSASFEISSARVPISALRLNMRVPMSLSVGAPVVMSISMACWPAVAVSSISCAAVLP